MTGFRIAYGGAQQHFGVTPDVTTMGKVIGGGLPVGAYGGRRDIMELVAPAGPMYQAGTLSGKICVKLVTTIDKLVSVVLDLTTPFFDHFREPPSHGCRHQDPRDPQETWILRAPREDHIQAH